MPDEQEWWPSVDEELVELQHRLAGEADTVRATDAWSLPPTPEVGGCFVTFARGEAGPGGPGDRAWGGAVVWRVPADGDRHRSVDHHLRGAGRGARGATGGQGPSPASGSGAPGSPGAPRRADDVVAQGVARLQVAAGYVPGLLAKREGPVLAAAVSALRRRPGVLLVDATGLDHPRRAGLAIHLGAATDLPTVGVTRRPLVATGDEPDLHRGERRPLLVDGELVGYRMCTSTGVRSVVAHAGWRTTPETAAEVVLVASTEAARTPVPLQEARRVAREARSLGGG